MLKWKEVERNSEHKIMQKKGKRKRENCTKGREKKKETEQKEENNRGKA